MLVKWQGQRGDPAIRTRRAPQDFFAAAQTGDSYGTSYKNDRITCKFL